MMALQTLSPAPSSSGTGTSQPSSTSTSGGFGSGVTLNPGSSIPFSFLIAFIALFLFFLGCGLGTRRAAIVIRRNLGLTDPAASGSRRQEEKTKPAIWDARPEMEEWNTHGRWDVTQPLAATFVREKSDDDEVPTSAPASPSTTAAPPRFPISPLPYQAVRPVGGLGYLPSRHGGLVTIHPPARWPPPTPNPPQVPPTPNPPRNPPTPTRTPTPTAPTQTQGGFLQRIRNWLSSHVYTAALLAEFGLGLRRRPRNEKPEPLKPVEGLQVSVLIAMPSAERQQTRKLREKLNRELNRESSSSSGNGVHAHSEKGKEVLVEDALDVHSEFGELVIGTVKIPWEESLGGD